MLQAIPVPTNNYSGSHKQLSERLFLVCPVCITRYAPPADDDADQVRALFSDLVGKPVDASFLLIPPFYTECGVYIRIGRGAEKVVYEEPPTFEHGKFVTLRDGADATVIATGIGVNLAHSPDDVERPATSFAAHIEDAPPPTPLEALDRLSQAFSGWLDAWGAQGFAAIAEAWTVRAQGLGQACVARLGSETVEGVAEGLDIDGALRLRLADGAIRRITAGDVFFEGA